MWEDHRDGFRVHEGLARAMEASGAPDGQIWNGRTWQEWDSWDETGLVTFALHAGEPAALRAECQCVWHGPAHPVGQDPAAAAAAAKTDWQQHIAAATVAMPPLDVAEEISDLFSQLSALVRERPLAALGALRALEENIEPQRVAAVARARHQGAAWHSVADALGVARQSAWEKYQFAGTDADVDAAYARTARTVSSRSSRLVLPPRPAHRRWAH